MGPFTLADMVGLDTCKNIMDGWHAEYPTVELFQVGRQPYGVLEGGCGMR